MQTSAAAAACIVGSDTTNQQSGSNRLWETAWRALEPLPLLFPLCTILASLAALQVLVMPTASLTALMLAPTLFMHVVGPIIDVLLGEHPPALQTKAQHGPSARLVPLVFAALQLVAELLAVTAAGHIWASQAGPAQILLLGLCLGASVAVGMSCSHELLHRRHWLYQLACAQQLAWAQFWVYPRIHHHHHKHIGTPADPLTARVNESIYAFIPRDWWGSHEVAWRLECEAAKKEGRSVWSVRNKMLKGLALQAAMLALSWCLGGVPGLFVHLMATGLGTLLSMTADYTLHYGVVRCEQASGAYEPFSPYDAFNSTYLVENSIAFHFLMHSDHHLVVSKPYTNLNPRPSARLAPAMFLGLLAFIPPLWFKLANPKVLAAMEAKRHLKIRHS